VERVADRLDLRVELGDGRLIEWWRRLFGWRGRRRWWCRWRPSGWRGRGGAAAGGGGEVSGFGAEYLIQRFGESGGVTHADAGGGRVAVADEDSGELREGRPVRRGRDPFGEQRFDVEDAALGNRQGEQLAVLDAVRPFQQGAFGRPPGIGDPRVLELLRPVGEGVGGELQDGETPVVAGGGIDRYIGGQELPVESDHRAGQPER